MARLLLAIFASKYTAEVTDRQSENRRAQSKISDHPRETLGIPVRQWRPDLMGVPMVSAWRWLPGHCVENSEAQGTVTVSRFQSEMSPGSRGWKLVCVWRCWFVRFYILWEVGPR